MQIFSRGRSELILRHSRKFRRSPRLCRCWCPNPKPAWLSRQDLERIASGPVSDLFGPEFAPIDQYRRVVRMPMPPLLLADRVMSIDAQPRSMATGAIHTETDITRDSWFVFRDRIPAGILVESGQADLLLISWLGVDFEMKGERVYRLLGCELTFHGGAPQVGDTLCHEIHIDRHAKQGPVRLFFFHSDTRVNGEVRLSVHNGQAGFFTDEELAGSNGVLWDPQTTGPTPECCRSEAESPWSAPALHRRSTAPGRDGPGVGVLWERLRIRRPSPARTGLLRT